MQLARLRFHSLAYVAIATAVFRLVVQKSRRESAHAQNFQGCGSLEKASIACSHIHNKATDSVLRCHHADPSPRILR